MVDEVMDVLGLELVEQGHGHSAITHGGDETNAPVHLVAGAEGYLVPFLEATLLEAYMQVGDTLCHVAIAQGNALIIGQRSAIPVILDAFLEQFVYRAVFHTFIFC